MATAGMSTYELEGLFLEKLTEKYDMNERSIKKAFSRFDSDGNGLLNLKELVAGFEMFLNGVNPKQVKELVFSYDVNGDGSISFEEFFQFLLNRQQSKNKRDSNRNKSNYNNKNTRQSTAGANRSSIGQEPFNRQEYQTEEYDDLTSQPDEYSEQISEYSLPDDTRSDMSSVFDPTLKSAVSSRAKVFVESLKSYLHNEALKMRRSDKIVNSHQISSSEMCEKASRMMLERAFVREANLARGRNDDRINLRSFCNVLKSFQLPGLPNVRMEVLKHLFKQCVDPSEPSLAIPGKFINKLFSSDAGAEFYGDMARRGSNPGRGPVKDRSGGEAGLPNEIAAIPDRFTCSKSRTTYFTPSNFSEEMLQASAANPCCEVERDHVFGMRLSDLYSGQGLYCLHGGGQGSRESYQGHIVVYGASSMGVVHNLETNSQLFFDRHDDELTCITVDPSCNYVLSGQLGKHPSLYIWDVHTAEFVKEIGKGFFARAVCAAVFTHDTRFVVAAGCDEKHCMGIWDVHSGDLVCETTLSNGIPPQIRSIKCAPDFQYTSYVNSKHDGLNYAFVTSGERHLKIWSFQQPSNKSSQGVLAFKAATMGQRRRSQLSKQKSAKQSSNEGAGKVVDQAKLYYCSDFINRPGHGADSRNDGHSCDIVSGGDNGYLYLWVEATCECSVRASRGAIRCIKVVGENIFCGCMEGNVKMFDANLQRLAVFSAVLGASPSPPSRSGISSGGGNARRGGVLNARAQSARRASRTLQQSSSASGGARPRPSTPKRAVGRVEARPGTATATHSQSADLSVLSLDIDYSPFFYSDGGRGGTSGETLVVATAAGSCMRLHIDSPSPRPPSDLFSFHTGSVWALAPAGSLGTIFMTGGEDRYLCVWSMDSRSLICRRRLQASPRCCCFDHSNKFIAVGLSRGLVSLHYFAFSEKTNKPSTISDVLASRQDCSETISDIKFSPSSDKLAVGSHDNFIDIYEVTLLPPRNSNDSPGARLHPLKRFRGHSSYITHIDWSLDGRLVQSTCGAYEILYWDVSTGKQFLSPNPSDLKWKTYTCVLGFGVMGIWPPFADGTDINSLHVSRDKSLVVTGDDSGFVNVMNYPCVVKNAPRKSYNGHSSHVTNVRFMYDDSVIISVGGNDKCVISWIVTKTKLRKAISPETGWM